MLYSYVQKGHKKQDEWKLTKTSVAVHHNWTFFVENKVLIFSWKWGPVLRNSQMMMMKGLTGLIQLRKNIWGNTEMFDLQGNALIFSYFVHKCYSTVTCKILLNWPHSKLGQYCTDSLPNLGKRITVKCESLNTDWNIVLSWCIVLGFTHHYIITSTSL